MLRKTLIAGAIFSSCIGSAYAGSEIETLIIMLHENGMVNDAQLADYKQN